MTSEFSDAQLMELVALGRHDAFAELVKRHTDKVFRVAFYSLQNKSDADDVVQNIFIKLWQKPHLWDASKSKLSTWLHRVAINACHDLHRRQAKSIDIEDESLVRIIESDSVNHQDDPSNQGPSWQQEYLEDAIAQLSSAQRDAINLVVYAELPQQEASQVLGVSLKALESLLVRAKRKMAQIVSQRVANDQPQTEIKNKSGTGFGAAAQQT